MHRGHRLNDHHRARAGGRELLGPRVYGGEYARDVHVGTCRARIRRIHRDRVSTCIQEARLPALASFGADISNSEPIVRHLTAVS